MSKKKKTETSGERKPNWKEYMATVEDIQNFLMDRILLRHNVITGRVECRVIERDYFQSPTPPLPLPYDGRGMPTDKDGAAVPLPCRGGVGGGVSNWTPINDRIVNSLWAELSATKVVRVQDMYRVIESDFVPEFHPFRYYLKHLPKWDGQNHILAMSVSVSVKGHVQEQMLFAEYLTKWLVGMVAGWVDESVVNNVILVLIGEQGSYKTTWFNYLLPPELSNYFYTKTNAQRMGRDDLLTLAQYGLVCCEELDTMNARELNQLKAAVTMPSIDERAAYAHFHEHRKHIASFCGTGNNVQFLSDPTGNRRWLPFEVESIESPREHPFDYTGIYSQAYALYQQGFRYWFTQEEIVRLQQHNSQFEAPRLEKELVHLYFRKPVGIEGGIFMPVARAMQIVSANISQKLSAVHLGRAFNDLGYKRVKHGSQRGYIVVQRTGEEMAAAQRIMADEAKPERDSRQ